MQKLFNHFHTNSFVFICFIYLFIYLFFLEEEEEEEEWLPKGKDKGKINKIFNTSIMALSFLAFGGYLLCLIVNAIKEKNNEMMATAVTPTVQQQLVSFFRRSF